MNTFLTLLLVPAYFSLAIDVEQWIGRKFGAGMKKRAHDINEAIPEASAPGGPMPQPAE